MSVETVWSAIVGGAPLVLLLFCLESILSIDNAAALGVFAGHLPHEPLPREGFFNKLLYRILPHWLLENQQRAVLRLGLFGAYFFRGAMLKGTEFILEHSWVRYLGAFYLCTLVWNYFVKDERFHLEIVGLIGRLFSKVFRIKLNVSNKGFWGTLVAIEIMDLTFSIDNVVAAVSVTRNLWIIFAGVFMGILAMRFFAGIFTVLAEREPSIADAAYLIILSIAIRMVLTEAFHLDLPDYVQLLVSVVILGFTVLIARNERARETVVEALEDIVEEGEELFKAPEEEAPQGQTPSFV